MQGTRAIVTFLTDYGPGSEHVGALHLVVAAQAPQVRCIDIAHDVPAADIRQGALLLARLAPLLPDAVHMAVIDPGVGGDRRGVAVELEGGGALVGPDNGVLGPAAEAMGAVAAVVLDPPLPGRPATFHGRDLFAPVAARLAAGTPLPDLGWRIDPATLLHPHLPSASIENGQLCALAIGVDAFGNIQLLAGAAELRAVGIEQGERVWVAVGDRRHPATVARTFSDVPERAMLVHLDSHGHIAVAVNGRNAARRIGAVPGDMITLGRWP
jgi:S-adenosyl-L-methionine hydrolase (adenosine-forming)